MITLGLDIGSRNTKLVIYNSDDRSILLPIGYQPK